MGRGRENPNPPAAPTGAADPQQKENKHVKADHSKLEHLHPGDANRSCKAGGLNGALFDFWDLLPHPPFLGAVAIEGEEFLLFACALVLVSIIGSLIMMSLLNH